MTAAGPGGSEGPGGSDALARATRAMQDEPEAGWPELADRVSHRLRTVSRPGRPLTVQASATGILRVDQRVVVDTVRRAAAQVPGCRPVEVAVDAEGEQVTRVRLEVWARYGADVVAVAVASRAAVAGALLDVLALACPVDVVVVDVEEG